MSECDDRSYPVVKQIVIADRTYDLLTRRCSSCENDHFEIWRWSRSSFSRYHMPPEFESGDFEDFVASIDETLLMSAPSLMEDFHTALSEVNSKEGIAADNSFAFRLLEYGRHRANKLQKEKLLDAIVVDKEPSTSQERSIRTAFELGVAVAEHHVVSAFEEYIHAGMAISEWRQEGLPKARAERLRQGKRTHDAICAAAQRLYSGSPDLARNDSETARRILNLRLPELQKGSGMQIGFDAITRHLRQARNCTRRANTHR